MAVALWVGASTPWATCVHTPMESRKVSTGTAVVPVESPMTSASPAALSPAALPPVPLSLVLPVSRFADGAVAHAAAAAAAAPPDRPSTALPQEVPHTAVHRVGRPARRGERRRKLSHKTGDIVWAKRFIMGDPVGVGGVPPLSATARCEGSVHARYPTETALGRCSCLAPSRAATRRPIVSLMKKLRVDVWSDIACPVVLRRQAPPRSRAGPLPAARRGRHRLARLRARPFCAAGPDSEGPYAERLAEKYGASVAQAEDMIQRMTEVGAEDGLEFRFDRIRPGNTFDAHRVLHLAAERGVQDAVKERFLRGYMTEGEAIGETEVLSRLAGEAGLDPDEVARCWRATRCERGAGGRGAGAQLGITGVPFFVVGERYAVSGAQPAELLLGVLQKAWSEVAAKGVCTFRRRGRLRARRLRLRR